MNYDGATGWLVGEPNQGLACMFTMMNDARFQVGMQGLGIAEASYQGALEYARERLQSRAPQGAQQPEAKADAIIHQPDVRRMLLTQKSIAEGCRALSLWYAKTMDVEKYTQGDEKAAAENILQFLTPITKSFMTDMGLEMASHGIQVFGGHGYVREWGMEQLMRDARIAQLYEGTNGIQAVDLIGRKLTRSGGVMMRATHADLSRFTDAIEDDGARIAAQDLLAEWKQVSEDILTLPPEEVAGAASDYLNYSAYAIIGVLWYSMADAAVKTDNSAIAAGKVKTRDFYMKRVLPRKDMHKATIFAGSDDLLAVNDREFDYV